MPSRATESLKKFLEKYKFDERAIRVETFNAFP